MILDQGVAIDPLFAAAVDPAAEWFRLAWLCPDFRLVMELPMAAATQAAHDWADRQVRSAWRHATSPAHALVLTLARVGWQPRSAFEWTAHDEATFSVLHADWGGARD